MKNGTNQGFDQHYNAQVAVTQDSFLIVATTLSNHPTDYGEALPTLDADRPGGWQTPRGRLGQWFL
jgi:hypothetical protein